MSLTLTAEAVGRSATPLMMLYEVVFEFYSAKKRTDVVWMKCLKEHGEKNRSSLDEATWWTTIKFLRKQVYVQSVYSAGFD